MATLTAGQSATVSIPAGDTWTATKTALNEGKFSVVDASGIVRDAGVFGNTALTAKTYGPYFDNNGVSLATTLTIACTTGSLTYAEVPASGGGGGSGTGLTPVNKTANYNATALNTGSLYNNSGAAGSVTISLPAATVGLLFGGYVATAQALALDAAGTDTINNGGDVSAAGGNIQTSTVGNYVALICNVIGQWSSQGIIGDWTLT